MKRLALLLALAGCTHPPAQQAAVVQLCLIACNAQVQHAPAQPASAPAP